MGIGNIGWSEFLLIILIVLVFFGPRRLPEIANAIGRSLREFQKALNEVRTEISQAAQTGEERRTGTPTASPYPLGPAARGESGPEARAAGAIDESAGPEEAVTEEEAKPAHEDAGDRDEREG